MPRNTTKDRCAADMDAAAKRATAKGSGNGGIFKDVTFTPGKSEVYNKKRK